MHLHLRVPVEADTREGVAYALQTCNHGVEDQHIQDLRTGSTMEQRSARIEPLAAVTLYLPCYLSSDRFLYSFFLHPSVQPSICLRKLSFIYLCIHPSIYLFLYLSLRLNAAYHGDHELELHERLERERGEPLHDGHGDPVDDQAQGAAQQHLRHVGEQRLHMVRMDVRHLYVQPSSTTRDAFD